MIEAFLIGGLQFVVTWVIINFVAWLIGSDMRFGWYDKRKQ